MICKIRAVVCAVLACVLLAFGVAAYEDTDKDGLAETTAPTAAVRVPARLPIAGKLEGTYTDEMGIVFALTDTEAIVIGYDDNLPSLTVPDTCQGLPVTAVAESAFASKVKLTAVVLPDSVKTIDREAFAFSFTLREVSLPSGLTSLPEGCFLGCDSLQKIILPEGLREIGPSAFEGCIRLRNLSVPASVEVIAEDAFVGCEALILDCANNAMAREFAAAHNIDTSFFTSSTFVLLLSFALTVPLFALLLLIRVLYKRYRAKKKTK